MRLPGIYDSIMRRGPSDRVTMLDLLDNAPSASTSLLDGSVRDDIRRSIVERAAAASLSRDSQLLFAAIRHLWERTMVAAGLEHENTCLLEMASRLVSECILSLQGGDAEARSAWHGARAIEIALDRTGLPHPTDNAT